MLKATAIYHVEVCEVRHLGVLGWVLHLAFYKVEMKMLARPGSHMEGLRKNLLSAHPDHRQS